MGAYKCMQEIYQKKRSDVMRFLLRIRAWQYRHLNKLHRAPRPTRPEKARRLGYKAKQGYVIYRIRIRRGGRKRPVPKGATYGKPKGYGVNQLKPTRNLQSLAEVSSIKIDAYKYMQEIYRKKRSDVMRFLLRIRAWQYRHLNKLHRAPRPTRPEKARRLGYKAKQGYVIYRIRIRRGGLKRSVPKGATYGKPKGYGVNQLKPTRNLQSLAEVSSIKIDAYKYMQEIYRKKRSDVMRFLLRIRAWQYRHLNKLHRAPRPTRPEKARRLGYKAKQGYVIYRIRIRRGGLKRSVPKGATYGKPKGYGVNQLKPTRNLQSLAEVSSIKIDAYKYMQEIYRKKRSDVMRFLLRIRAWQYRHLNKLHRAPRPTRPEKASRLGYKAKQGYVIYRIRIRRGGRKRPVPKGATYGKPKSHGVNQLKPTHNLQSLAEVCRRLGSLRVLNSYWVAQDSTFKYYKVIVLHIRHNNIMKDASINWMCNPTHGLREMHGKTSAGKNIVVWDVDSAT
ncbi:60S ribosomal protein L15-like 2 [Homarus americanus]|uniref:Ribosomal protein L15 n=1 Tax=Homarus americanus TaxID=6706 RepID=A0A8J5N493_HOMAM|nr:60S ribosomal protein L15-like 2 [Homarus americanus]